MGLVFPLLLGWFKSRTGGDAAGGRPGRSRRQARSGVEGGGESVEGEDFVARRGDRGGVDASGSRTHGTARLDSIAWSWCVSTRALIGRLTHSCIAACEIRPNPAMRGESSTCNEVFWTFPPSPPSVLLASYKSYITVPSRLLLRHVHLRRHPRLSRVGLGLRAHRPRGLFLRSSHELRGRHRRAT